MHTANVQLIFFSYYNKIKYKYLSPISSAAKQLSVCLKEQFVSWISRHFHYVEKDKKKEENLSKKW